MGFCKDCYYCETLKEKGILFSSTGYFCTNKAVVQAKGKGKYHHDIRVEANGSCKLFEKKPSISDIGYR